MFSLTLCSCCSLYWGPVRIIRPETDLQPAGPIDAQVYTVVTRSGDGRKPIVKGGSGGGKERSNCYFVLVNSQFEKGRDLGRLSDIFCQFHFWKCSSRPWNINLRNYGRNGRILMVWHGHFRTFSELNELLCLIWILTRTKLEITSSWNPLVTECDATQDNFGRKISQVDEINYDRTKYVWTCGKLQRNSTTKYPFSASWAFSGSCMIIQFSQKCVTSSTERAEWTGIGTEV